MKSKGKIREKTTRRKYSLKEGLKNTFHAIAGKAEKQYGALKIFIRVKKDEFIALVERKLAAPARERNRFILLSLSLVLFADYVMICFHTDRMVFDIFPSLPSLENIQKVKVYFPSPDGRIACENRQIPDLDGKERIATLLLKEVREGSRFENTRLMVPVNMVVKKIWIREEEPGKEICVIDIEPVVIKGDISVIPGSEKLFREALSKTITENIPSIKEVVLLEKGIQRQPLWDVN